MLARVRIVVRGWVALSRCTAVRWLAALIVGTDVGGPGLLMASVGARAVVGGSGWMWGWFGEG